MSIKNQSNSLWQSEFISHHNHARLLQNLSVLIQNDTLTEMARNHAYQCLSQNHLFHDRVPYHGGQNLLFGEGNLIPCSEKIVSYWLAEQAHRMILLSPLFYKIGVYFFLSKNDSLFVVANYE